MAKQSLKSIVLIGFLCLAALTESAQVRRQNSRLTQRTRSLARQEVAPADEGVIDVVTPYPLADELKPVVPFEESPLAEPTPDEVYGPPELTYNTPDEIYGPPEINQNSLIGNAADVADAGAESFQQELPNARLIAARRRSARLSQQRKSLAYRQRSAARPAKLRATPGKRF